MRSCIAFLFFISVHGFAMGQIITTVVGHTAISPAGVIVDSCAFYGDGGPATTATLKSPTDVCRDAEGNLYIASMGRGVSRIDAATGIITTIATIPGIATSFADSIPATNAVTTTTGICMDASGNLIIANYAYQDIRKINITTGIITTIAGQLSALGYEGDNGPATAAKFNSPIDVKIDATQNLYIADLYNNRIRKIDAVTGIITTIVGGTFTAFGGDGGPATAAYLLNPSGLYIDNVNNIYIADAGHNRVRKIAAATGIITTIAGNGSGAYSGMGGPATAAAIAVPRKVTIDDSGNIYISTKGNGVASALDDSRILKVSAATGIISLFAGGPIMVHGDAGYPGDGRRADSAYVDANGMYYDHNSHIYVADEAGCRLRKITLPAPPADTTNGVTQVKGNAPYYVYPNPTAGLLIAGGITGSTAWSIYTVTGAVVAQGTLWPNRNMIDIADYPQGTYLLQLTGEDGRRSILRVLRE